MSNDRSIGDHTTAASIERQLGEMVGTVKMTVTAVDNLRQSVERLVERAAFKGDLDSLRREIATDLDGLKAEIKAEREKIGGLQRTVWLASGGAFVIGLLLKFVDFAKIIG